MDPNVVATAVVAFLVAGCVKGVIGLGLPLTSIAILGSVIGLREAIPLIVIPVLLTNLWQVLQGGALISLLRRFWLLNLCLCAGTWVGTVVLFIVDPKPLLAALGAVVCIYVVVNLTAVTARVKPGTEPFWGPVVGLVSGVLTGITGSVGAPVAIYMQALGLDKDAFLQAISLSFLITAVIWIAALADQSALDRATLAYSTAALAPAFAGMWVGQRLRGRLSQERFRKWVFAFLLIVGANLIRKGLF